MIVAGRYQWIAGLVADTIAVGSLLWLARYWAERKSRKVEKKRQSVPVIKGRQPVPAHACNRREP